MKWEGEAPFSITAFLEENETAFSPLSDNVNDIILLNDLKNMHGYIKVQCADYIAGSSKRSREALDAEFYQPSLFDKETIREFLVEPDELPEFIVSFLAENKECTERYENFDSLYAAYYDYLGKKDSDFFKSYSLFESSLRKVIAAFRARSQGLDMEISVPGSDEITDTILANRTASDFGLKYILPYIGEMVEVFKEDTLNREKKLDRIRFSFLENFTGEDPFKEDCVYAYIFKLLLLERWQMLDREKGKQIVSNIVTGEIS
ncbi:hypothetical protein ES708_18814 [subsurface metagenome]